MLQFACSQFATAAEFTASDCACSIDPFEDADLIEALLDQASDMLYILSGGRIHGVCTKTVYPMKDRGCWNVGGVSVRMEGIGIGVSGVPLRGPATTVTSVKINGVTISPSEYVLVHGAQSETVLHRIDDEWPSSNNIDDPLDSWTVTFTFGRPADFITKIAAIELACELVTFAKTGTSRLPIGVTSANIQGASISLRDRAEALREDADYIPAVARFLGVYAPDGRSRSGVYSPDLDYPLLEVE